MENLAYYISIFRRRLPYFLAVATVISAISIIISQTLPPAYESRMVLLVESPQIPEELAASTVRTSAFEQLQVVQQRLLTRSNMIDIAREFDVLPDLNKMNPDEIVSAMRARTRITTTSQRRSAAPLMTVTFEAPKARTAAEVLNKYLLIIQQQDTEFRKGRAGDTLAFFVQEVERLSEQLDLQSARILEFQKANTNALPDSLEFRLDQQAVFRDRLAQIDRDISELDNQRARLVQLYELTGNANATQKILRSPEEQQLDELNAELDAALVIYSQQNPKVKVLKARIAQLEEKISALAPTFDSEVQVSSDNLPPVLTIQLGEIDTRIETLQAQKISVQAQLEAIDESLAKTPEVTIALEEMTRKYEAIQLQYNTAQGRLSKAQTGDRIETRSRGQRIAVVEQPAVPSQPTKPNRTMIAGGGMSLGIIAGVALVLLLEILNTTARRPEDIVSKLQITPLTTIPYIQTKGQRFKRRSIKLIIVLAILTGIPAVIFAVHTYYLPLDLLAEQAMNKIGVRW